MRGASWPLLFALALAPIGCQARHPLSAADLAPARALTSTYLRYRVQSPRGEWTREFAVTADGFAELRRTRDRVYALGLTGALAWLRVGSRPPVAIDGDLAADERRDAEWVAMRFGQSDPRDHVEIESCGEARCTLVATPPAGHALWIDVDRATRRPESFQWITQDGAVESCDVLAWSDADGAPAIASASCGAIVDGVGRETTTWTLEERRVEHVPPEWALVDPDAIVPLRVPHDPVRFTIADPSSRVYVPVQAGGAAPLNLVLDTGSPVTVLSHRVADALGVVPSPDPPLHVRPPYLPEGSYDAAIVDRLVIGDLELHGVPVLVARDDGPFESDEAGLLGMDLMSRYVVDVDGPASTLRIWPRERFRAGVAFTDVPFWGASHGQVIVSGEVDDDEPVPVLVDTGAPVSLVVGGPAMHAAHPHESHGEDAMLREDDGAAADYWTDVDAFRLGPFALPRMPVVGHDRRPDLPFLDDDAALVGLGVLRHFRFAIDAGRGVVHVAPGPSYTVLERFGIEIDERGGAPTVTRIVDGEHEWRKPLNEGDVVLAVDGRHVRSRDDALAAIAGARGDVRLVVERSGNVLARTLALR